MIVAAIILAKPSRLTFVFHLKLFFMKQVNAGRLKDLLKTKRLENAFECKGFSKTMTMISSAIVLSLQLLSGKATAQVAAYTGTGGTSTTISYSANSSGTALLYTGLGTNSPCSTGGLSGLTNNGVTTFSTSNGHIYFTVTADPGYVMNITSFTCKLRRSGSGLTKVRMAYYTSSSASTVNDLVDKAPDNVSCGSGSTVHSWNTATGGALPTGATTVTFELFPYAPVSSGGVIQVNQITIGGTVTLSVPTCPTLVAGSITPASATVCQGTATTLSLTGGTTGSNIAYQWQSSATGSGSWSDITGATNTVYTATPSTLTYYRVNTTCILSGGATTNSSNTAITVDPAPNAGSITGSAIVNIGGTTTLSNTTASSGAGFVGVWSSSSTSVATIDALTGTVYGLHSGNTTITYTVTNTSTGCNAYTTFNESVIYPGDLAIYEGTGGSSTSVTGIPGETVTSLSATGFGSATPCSTGGISGLTIPTSVNTYSASGPHISYIVTPGASNALNVTRFWVSSRSSGTGPDSGRLAYRIGGGAWISEGFSHVLSTSGSCGAHTNTWSWTPAAALNGITSNIEIAIFPYHPGAATGTFQLQQLEIEGTISSSTPCSGTPTAGTITPATTIACLSGYANLTFSGDSGPGISYQWQQSVSGGAYTDIAGANSLYYTSPVYTTVPTNITYQVVTTCAGGSTATSVAASFSVTPMPSAIDPLPAYLLVGAGNSVTLTQPDGTGKWFTQYPDVATIDSLTGEIIGNIAGITAVIYKAPGFGCIVTDTIKVIQPNTLSVYLGKGGNSTIVTPITTPITSAELSAVTASGAFGTNTACSRGGVSGYTVPTSITSFSASNPYISHTLTIPAAASSMVVTGIYTTVRSSGSGPASYSIGYRLNGGTWIDGGDFATDIQSCGVSSVDQSVIFASPLSMIGTDLLEVGVFPYSSVSNTGTFQVNTIDITGTVKCPQLSISNPIDGGTYGSDCDGLVATASVPGGTWSSTNPSAATIDPVTGVITFFNIDDVTDIIYTAPCGNTALVSINVPPAAGEGACDGTGARHATATGITTTQTSTNITIFPNPSKDVLNIKSAEAVDVMVISMDGKKLLEQKNTRTINIDRLSTGVYMVRIYNTDGTLLKTVRFEKK